MSGSRADDPFSAVLRRVDHDYLRPSLQRVETATNRAASLISEIDSSLDAKMYRIEDAIPHGSTSRKTAISGFDDVDYLLVLDRRRLRTQTGHDRSPQDTIIRLGSEISRRRAGLVSMGSLEVRNQTHSVGVIYPGADFRIDLVPALRVGRKTLIPDRSKLEWVETDPEMASKRLDAATAHCPHVRVAVRLVKAWSRARGQNSPIGSFALETLVVEQALQSRPPLSSLVCGLLLSIADQPINRRLVLMGSAVAPAPVLVEDPASQANLCDGLNYKHRKALISSCRRARSNLRKIEAIAECGRFDAAVLHAAKYFLGSWF